MTLQKIMILFVTMMFMQNAAANTANVKAVTAMPNFIHSHLQQQTSASPDLPLMTYAISTQYFADKAAAQTFLIEAESFGFQSVNMAKAAAHIVINSSGQKIDSIKNIIQTHNLDVDITDVVKSINELSAAASAVVAMSKSVKKVHDAGGGFVTEGPTIHKVIVEMTTTASRLAQSSIAMSKSLELTLAALEAYGSNKNEEAQKLLEQQKKVGDVAKVLRAEVTTRLTALKTETDRLLQWYLTDNAPPTDDRESNLIAPVNPRVVASVNPNVVNVPTNSGSSNNGNNNYNNNTAFGLPVTMYESIGPNIANPLPTPGLYVPTNQPYSTPTYVSPNAHTHFYVNPYEGLANPSSAVNNYAAQSAAGGGSYTSSSYGGGSSGSGPGASYYASGGCTGNCSIITVVPSNSGFSYPTTVGQAPYFTNVPFTPSYSPPINNYGGGGTGWGAGGVSIWNMPWP